MVVCECEYKSECVSVGGCESVSVRVSMGMNVCMCVRVYEGVSM